jgi:deoxyadenosine/deoxycytidine kinase
MTGHHYIVVEGPLGVGKTSLAKLLGERLNAHALLEDTEENPFLPDFYRSPKKFAFKAQIFFLLRRYRQAADIDQLGLFERAVIADYLFEKDRLFARLNLEDDEFWLYEQLFHLLRDRVSKPDLVIFLQARTDVLMDRIRKRGRKYEKGIGRNYLTKLNQAFNDFFFHYSDSPLLVVNASEIDYVNVPGDLDDLLKKIEDTRAGTQYYVPISSK